MRRALAAYPIVDLGARLSPGATFEAVVAALLRGGATMIQLRDKMDKTSRLLELVSHVRAFSEDAGVPLVVNDRVDLAIAARADGVHVGQKDLPVADVLARARAAGRADLFVGASIRTVDEAEHALDAGASYLSVSPVFDTPTKADAERGVGLTGVALLRARFPEVPLVGIGGIDLGRAPEVVRAGADGVAFISAIGTDPERAVRAMKNAVLAGLYAPRETEAARG